jgi:hypothetical protein
MAGQQPLELLIKVRILVPEPAHAAAELDRVAVVPVLAGP